MRSRVFALAVVASSILSASLALALPAEAASPDATSPGTNSLPGGGGGPCSFDAYAESPEFPVNIGTVTIRSDSCQYPIRAKIYCQDGYYHYSGAHTAAGKYTAYCDAGGVTKYGWQVQQSGNGTWTTYDWGTKY